jgi:hypothetical protein
MHTFVKTMCVLAAAVTVATVQAQEANGEVCAALLCMSGPDSSSAPHQCKPYVEAYFDIKVYKHGTFSTKFDPVRTANKRREVMLDACAEAREVDREQVHAKFGMLEYSPFHFN